MAYNVRIIEYPNGELQVRHYSFPLEREEPDFYESEKIYDSDKYMPNPFDGQMARIVDNFRSVSSKQAESEIRSYNRTKQKIYEYSRCVKWEKFITLTFNQEKVDRYNFSECSRLARQWLHNQRRNASDLQYLLVPELHKDGAWHFHGLLAQTGSMSFVDSGKRDKKRHVIYNMGAWSYGWTTATDVSDTHKVSKYIGKYITKDLCGLTKGKQRYFVSSNMPKPVTSVFFVSDSDDFKELLEGLADSYGVEIVHESKPRSPGAYVDVDYYELR